MKQALGMIETKGLVALFEATDAMLKSANVYVRRLAVRRFWTGDRLRRRGRGRCQSCHRRGR